MKKLIAMSAVFIIACCSNLFAQETHQSLLSIHEDYVIPSAEDQYWETAQKLTNLLTENKATEPRFWGFSLEGGTYMYVSEAENYASLDTNMWEEIAEKAGSEKVNEVMDGFGGTYRSHIDYMVVFHPEKSFKMDEITNEDVYRQWFFNYIYPEKLDEYYKAVDEWLATSKELNVPMGYGMYSNGFGMAGPVVVYMIWGKTMAEAQEKNAKTTEIMGEKRQELWNKMKSCIYKTETKRGWHLEELSYMPEE